MDNKMSRRSFLQKSAVLTAGVTVVPSMVFGKKFGYTAPSDKLNIAGVGVGGMGFANLKSLDSQNIVALCDVDWGYCESNGVFKAYPDAKKFTDWRVMYDQIGKEIDAVVVATADHTHAIIAAHAITMDKHVYVQKPLTHSVYESRLLTELAEKHKVATSMGNQGSSGEGVNLTCEWIWNGEIGEIRSVDAFTDRPIWPQGLNTPEIVDEIPETLNWDLFQGPAVKRDFNHIYTPWNWRGWWAYGTGALGDMACHILHPAFKALKLGYPVKVQGSSSMLLIDCAPVSQYVKLIYPARDNMPKLALPEVEVHWYDGGIKPIRPEGMPVGKNLNDAGGATIFYGTKDTLICGCYGKDPWLVSGRIPDVPKVERRVETSHEMDLVRACKENPSSRVETKSPFREAGPFNETVVMGVLAVRLQSLHRELEWDGQNMKFTNIYDDDKIRTIIKDGFSIKDGHPTFDRTMTEPVSAKEFAEELIKHTYHNGYSLPDMP